MNVSVLSLSLFFDIWCLVTVWLLQVTLELGQSEASIHATIQTLQIDDQSLDAQQPVVLGPASAVSKGVNISSHEMYHFLYFCTFLDHTISLSLCGFQHQRSSCMNDNVHS